MKKIITNEKFYITDIPNDKVKIRELIVFLGDNETWTADSQYEYATRYRFIAHDRKYNDYRYCNYTSPEDYHTVITYDDLLANYLPKDNRLDKIVDDVIKEVINEDYQNEHYKAQKIDTVARCKANMTLEQQKAICIFNIDRYLHREKKQNLSDIKKIKYYTNWLEEIEKELVK